MIKTVLVGVTIGATYLYGITKTSMVIGSAVLSYPWILPIVAIALI